MSIEVLLKNCLVNYGYDLDSAYEILLPEKKSPQNMQHDHLLYCLYFAVTIINEYKVRDPKISGMK